MDDYQLSLQNMPLEIYFRRLDAGELTEDEKPTAYQLGVIKACRYEMEQLLAERDEARKEAERYRNWYKFEVPLAEKAADLSLPWEPK